MDDHFDIGQVFEIGKFDITRLTCIYMGKQSQRALCSISSGSSLFLPKYLFTGIQNEKG